MDLYTTSFTYPRPIPQTPLRSSSPLPSSHALPGVLPPPSLPNVTAPGPSLKHVNADKAHTTASQVEKDWEAVQKICLEITTREGCLVTVTKEESGVETSTANPVDGETQIPAGSTTWNFHLSGGYQSVMAARGAILREAPRDNRTTIKVPRTDILESPLATISPLKADVRRRLDEIAADSQAHIAVLNMEIPGVGASGVVLATAGTLGAYNAPAQSAAPAPGHRGTSSTSSKGSNPASDNVEPAAESVPATASTAGGPTTAPVTFGLETERMCELAISGSIESVEIAKVRLLVMLDELSGLHSEVCDIDYKLHAIIAARKRCVIQSIQEETATNIYYPTPLVGVLNPPQPGSQQNLGQRNMMNGMGVQVTGGMGNNISGMNGMMPEMNMGMNGLPPQNRNNNGPVYNPHQHVQHPYQPQALHINPQGGRGMPYSGPGMQHYNGMNMGQNQGPMQMNHTGMSQMSQMSQMSNMSQMHGNQHGFQGRMGGNGNGPMMGMNMGMNMGGGPGHHNNGMMGGYFGHNNNHNNHNGHNHNAQNHLHLGMGGGPMNHMGGGHMMGGNNNTGMGMGGMQQPGMGNGMGMNQGMNMGMGMGGFNNGPHPGLAVHGGEQGLLGKANQVWITGEFFGVQRARDMLLNVAMQKSKLVISRDTAVLPRKLDWLLTERIEEIKAIMCDNGTYIQVPSVGSQASLITVFGDHRVNIERTIRSVMALACQFYVASFWLLPISFDVLMPQASLNPAQMQPVLKHIAHATGAEVVFKSNCFEMHGLEQEVRAAVMMVLELEVIASFHHEIRFQIELANEHRDFISGKKNGKINKIMKLAGVKIKFETFNDYNFLMDIAGNDLGALQGLSMLQEELPAEVSFHVPESYHKRIIGVGGKNIQRIMKLYGVYVKFSNAEEFAQLGGYLDNDDNVVARTPAKNSINLESMKQSVMEMVNPKDKDYTVESVSIPRRYHRTLLGEKSIFIHDIEHKTNSIVRFPNKETASDIVTIFGPESQVHIAAAMLLDHVPFEADLHVPPNPELTRLVNSPEFILFTERVKRDHQIAVVPSQRFGQGDEAIFKFRCQRSNIDFLGTARDSLEEFLSQHNIQVYPSHAHKRVDSFKDAFSHFNSKLLATSGAVGEGEGESLVERRPRPASVTNVRALFDGQGGAGFPRGDDGGLGFAGPLGFVDTRRMPDLWQGPQSVQPGRTDNEPSKRGSDPQLEEKVRQASAGGNVPPSHPQRVSARTQSLDITSNFSRPLSNNQSPFGPMPPSPSGIASSPNTATGQYFPGGSGNGNGTSTGSAGTGTNGGARYDATVDGIAQGLSNVQVSHQ